MTPIALILSLLLVVTTSGAVVAWIALKRRHLDRWIGPYLMNELRRRFRRRQASERETTIHVLLCIADHYEPSWGDVDASVADARVAAWTEAYPRLFSSIRDSDGRPPQHTFFYPFDQYIPRHVDAIADLCRAGFGEIEIHLHHDRDTAEHLTATLTTFTQRFAHEHDVLGRTPEGAIAYAFVHGNWALDNGRPDGRWCGVPNELEVLRTTGCYADFTFPSAPDVTQTRTINSIYYAVGCPHRSRSHEEGVHIGTAPAPSHGLLLIQGPLGLWRPRGSLKPRIENGCLQRSQPPSMERLNHWMRAGVSVPQRPDWIFIKLHTHGATEANQSVLLGEPMLAFHRGLAERAERDPRFRYHYVTAREMYNLAKAAEAGWDGDVAGARDFEIAPPTRSAQKLPLREQVTQTNRAE